LNLNNIFKDIVDMHPSRIVVYNNNGDFFYANISYIEAQNIDISDKKNLNFDKIKPCNITLEYLKEKLSVSKKFSIEMERNSAWFESIFFYANAKYIVHISFNITTLKEADRKIYYHANYDSLTALPNRSFFKKKLNHTLDESLQNGSKTALFFIDVDNFKKVNDTYGHNIGDKMLVTIAKRLVNSIRKDDIVARIGGDEFVIIAKNIKNIKNAKQLAFKLQEKIKQPLEIDTNIFNVSLSIGIAIYPQHAATSDDLLKNADIAMYEVKKEKRDGFKIYRKLMSNRAATRLLMQADIKRALKEKEFVMHYQPVVDFHNNSVVGAEALVRWYNTKKGILEPKDFLELVLSGDMEKEFGCMVFSKVLEDLKILNKNILDKKLTISINISKEQFFNPSFCSDLEDTSKKYNIDRSQIELKIVESQVMQNISVAKDIIKKLHLMGFKIVLDDFGVEYSSLNHLKLFEVDKLKIDKSFIKNMIKDKNDLNITKSIINTAKLFNLKVQAEGIETKEQYLKLRDIGCDYSQGFYHSNPLPIDDFINYFNKT
jgi:diguanylate cyclase (GGDEF)-like protein